MKMNEMLDKAVKVEMHLKRRGNTNPNANYQVGNWHNPLSRSEDKSAGPSQQPKSRQSATIF